MKTLSQLLSTTAIIILFLCCFGNGDIVPNTLFKVDPSAAQFTCDYIVLPADVVCPDIYTALLAYDFMKYNEPKSNGIIIELAAGTFTGVNNTNLNLYNSAYDNVIVITGANNGQVTIDLQNNGNFLVVNDSSSTGTLVSLNITVENITITNGNEYQGIAVNITTKDNTETSLTFNNVIVSNCKAASAGAAVAVVASQTTLATVAFKNSQFINNTANIATAYYGIGFGSVSFENCVINNNNATGEEFSAIIRTIFHSISIRNLTMNNNIAKSDGLFIITQSPDTVDIDSLSLNNNQILTPSANTSGLLKASYSTVAITNSNFTNNFGAPILYYNSQYPESPFTLTISGSTFNANTGSLYGGCLFLDVGATMNMSDCTFTSNSAVNEAGVIYLLETSPVNIKNTTFTKNTVINAKATASVIYADHSSGALNLTNVYIEDNNSNTTLPINCVKSTINLTNVTSNIKDNVILKCSSTCKVNGEQICGGGESSDHNSSSENSHNSSGTTVSFNFTSIFILILSSLVLLY